MREWRSAVNIQRRFRAWIATLPYHTLADGGKAVWARWRHIGPSAVCTEESRHRCTVRDGEAAERCAIRLRRADVEDECAERRAKAVAAARAAEIPAPPPTTPSGRCALQEGAARGLLERKEGWAWDRILTVAEWQFNG